MHDVEDVFFVEPWNTEEALADPLADLGTFTASSRLLFAPDGTLFMTVGGAFVGKPGYKPEIYSMGHRNQQGLAEPAVLWAPSISPSGLVFYSGDAPPHRSCSTRAHPAV